MVVATAPAEEVTSPVSAGMAAAWSTPEPLTTVVDPTMIGLAKVLALFEMVTRSVLSGLLSTRPEAVPPGTTYAPVEPTL
jgi:hypothetical protein